MLENELCPKCKTEFTLKAPNWSLIENINNGYTNDRAKQLLNTGLSMIEEFTDNFEKVNNLNKIPLSKIKDEIQPHILMN